MLDLGTGIFAHGQCCVALSRVRSLQGVMLVGLVRSLLDPKMDKKYGGAVDVQHECVRLSHHPDEPTAVTAELYNAVALNKQ